MATQLLNTFQPRLDIGNLFGDLNQLGYGIFGPELSTDLSSRIHVQDPQRPSMFSLSTASWSEVVGSEMDTIEPTRAEWPLIVLNACQSSAISESAQARDIALYDAVCAFSKYKTDYTFLFESAYFEYQAKMTVSRLYSLCAQHATRRAIDLVMDSIDDLLSSDQFMQADMLIRQLDPSKLNTAVLTTVLAATRPAKNRLSSRSQYLADCVTVLDAEYGASEMQRILKWIA